MSPVTFISILSVFWIFLYILIWICGEDIDEWIQSKVDQRRDKKRRGYLRKEQVQSITNISIARATDHDGFYKEAEQTLLEIEWRNGLIEKPKHLIDREREANELVEKALAEKNGVIVTCNDEYYERHSPPGLTVAEHKYVMKDVCGKKDNYTAWITEIEVPPETIVEAGQNLVFVRETKPHVVTGRPGPEFPSILFQPGSYLDLLIKTREASNNEDIRVCLKLEIERVSGNQQRVAYNQAKRLQPYASGTFAKNLDEFIKEEEEKRRIPSYNISTERGRKA